MNARKFNGARYRIGKRPASFLKSPNLNMKVFQIRKKYQNPKTPKPRGRFSPISVMNLKLNKLHFFTGNVYGFAYVVDSEYRSDHLKIHFASCSFEGVSGGTTGW